MYKWRGCIAESSYNNAEFNFQIGRFSYEIRLEIVLNSHQKSANWLVYDLIIAGITNTANEEKNESLCTTKIQTQ